MFSRFSTKLTIAKVGYTKQPVGKFYFSGTHTQTVHHNERAAEAVAFALCTLHSYQLESFGVGTQRDMQQHFLLVLT